MLVLRSRCFQAVGKHIPLIKFPSKLDRAQQGMSEKLCNIYIYGLDWILIYFQELPYWLCLLLPSDAQFAHILFFLIRIVLNQDNPMKLVILVNGQFADKRTLCQQSHGLVNSTPGLDNSQTGQFVD